MGDFEKGVRMLMKRKCVSNMKHHGIIIAIFLAVMMVISVTPVQCEDPVIKVGVLSHMGDEQCLEMWLPTVEYLTSAIPEYTFILVPLGYDEIILAVEDNEVDFILCNPFIYVELEHSHDAERIATLNNKVDDTSSTVFGTVIFTRADRDDIANLADIKGKSLMPVNEWSFGGWMIGWRELKDAGIDPYSDVKKLSFGGTHDVVVYAVLNGDVDVGIVRTNILEQMDAEDKIDIDDLTVINPQHVSGFPFVLSGRLYPEWAFAKVIHTPQGLAKDVAIALFKIEENNPAAIASNAGWTIPLDYWPVHECLKELRVGPYVGYGEISLYDAIMQNWYWVLLDCMFLIFMACLTGHVIKLNHRLDESKYVVEKARDNLENKVKERTVDLENVNIKLQQEINEREQVEIALRKTHEMFSTIMDSLDAIVYVADMETYEILFINNYTRDIFGDVLGKTCWKTFSIDQSGPCDFCTNDKLVDTNGEPVGIYSWEHYNDNAKHWYSIRDRAIRWIDGRIVKLQIAIDITKQKEDELERTRLSRIIESSLNEIYIFDAKTLHFIHVNEGALKNLGYTQEEMHSMTPLGVKPKLNEEGFNKRISLLLNHEEEIVEFQTVYSRADGSLYPVEVHLQLIKDVGEPVFLAIAIDITDRKAAENKLKKYAKKLKEANEKLKSLDRMKNEFLSNVSHELKTPLVSIEGYSEAIRGEMLGVLNDKQKKAMDTVIRNADRLERLINSILYLSIEESGNMKYYLKPIQIADVIEHSVLDMLSQAESHGLNIKNEVPDNLPLIQGDDGKLIQVMDNLIGNAIKFTPSGEITITAREDGSNLHIEVSDTGVGMPSEHIDKLFDRFYQGDGSTKRKYGGTGLGLHISKLIVEAHNGKIWAESEEGIGATIHVTLPKNSQKPSNIN